MLVHEVRQEKLDRWNFGPREKLITGRYILEQGMVHMSTSDKIKGYANEAVGSVKETVGKVVGSEQTEAEGAAQKIKGEGEVAVGKTKDAVKDAANKTADTINKNF